MDGAYAVNGQPAGVMPRVAGTINACGVVEWDQWNDVGNDGLVNHY